MNGKADAGLDWSAGLTVLRTGRSRIVPNTGKFLRFERTVGKKSAKSSQNPYVSSPIPTTAHPYRTTATPVRNKAEPCK